MFSIRSSIFCRQYKSLINPVSEPGYLDKQAEGSFGLLFKNSPLILSELILKDSEHFSNRSFVAFKQLFRDLFSISPAFPESNIRLISSLPFLFPDLAL